jgi:hypothetical protein
MSPGQPVSKKDFLERFYYNIKEYFKYVEEHDDAKPNEGEAKLNLSITSQDEIVIKFINYY